MKTLIRSAIQFLFGWLATPSPRFQPEVAVVDLDSERRKVDELVAPVVAAELFEPCVVPAPLPEYKEGLAWFNGYRKNKKAVFVSRSGKELVAKVVGYDEDGHVRLRRGKAGTFRRKFVGETDVW